MNDGVTNIMGSCHLCNEGSNRATPVPLDPWEWPSSPNERVHADCYGPMEGHMFLIMADAYSQWVTVSPTTECTKEVTLELGVAF